MTEKPYIAMLVQDMHDSVCRCGGQCRGYENDYEWFTRAVEDRWGSATPMEESLYRLGLDA
jgi:hypothetical protein